MPEWLEKLATASPGLIFAVMWWLERTERRENAKELKALSASYAAAFAELKGMLIGKRNGA